MRHTLFPVTLTTLLIAGCGGSMPVAPEAPQNYIPTAGTRHTYAPYASPTRIHPTFLGELHIGGDVEPREKLDLVFNTDDDINIYMGASRDGVGVHRLENYEADLLAESFSNDFRPFSVQPLFYIDPDFMKPENDQMRVALFDSLFLLNDALPPEFQMTYAGTKDSALASYGEIVVSLEDRSSISRNCGATAVACALPGLNRAFVRLPDDMDTSEFIYPRSVIVHELLHALGIRGHVDSIEFPDSILGVAGEYIPNGRHIISKIDREVLQIMYMSQLTETYNDWGEWVDVSFHLMGQSEDEAMQFGVALFNGLPQPWAHGTYPDTLLEDNHQLRGTAIWEGSLVGFSGSAPLFGKTELEVNIATLSTDGSEHDLRFRDIFYINRIESSDLSASSPRWFSTPDIDYKVSISGNFFDNVIGESYEDGWVDGAFMGENHEHMAGTVKRTDMIGAFGGSRD